MPTALISLTFLLPFSTVIRGNMNLGSVIKKAKLHYKCRNGVYPRSSNVIRSTVPDDKILWDVHWPQYNPIEYTSKSIHGQPWADPPIDDPEFKPEWNSLDGNIDRKSHFTTYKTVDGTPQNPVGRTGITGRGCLGRWGPNHAADPIVTRWKRSNDDEIERDPFTQKPILQFIAIERKDCKEWAIPGGMVDPGEIVTQTLKREFLEEAMDTLGADEKQRKEKEKLVSEFFKDGVEIYKGYVDDPRNTDNAWMETVATNFHDEDGRSVGQFELTAGDDAANVKWMDIESSLRLYASHVDFIQTVAQKHNSYW